MERNAIDGMERNGRNEHQRHAGLRLDDEARGLVAARGTRLKVIARASRTSPRASRRPSPSQRPAAPPRTPASPLEPPWPERAPSTVVGRAGRWSTKAATKAGWPRGRRSEQPTAEHTARQEAQRARPSDAHWPGPAARGAQHQEQARDGQHCQHAGADAPGLAHHGSCAPRPRGRPG